MEINEIKKDDFKPALDLALKIFDKFEAPDYSEKGIESFHNSLKDKEYTNQLKMYGAFSDGVLLGIIATRNSGNHIALFFVDDKAQRKGIGRKLFEKVCNDNRTGKITVNSSPFAVEIYHHLGFEDTDSEQIVDGIRFTPMEYTKPSDL